MSQSACSIALMPAKTIAPPPLAQNEWSYISDHSDSIRARIAADDHPLAEVLDHSRGGGAAEPVGDRRFADSRDAFVGHQLDDHRVELAGRDEVDVEGIDFHREHGREGPTTIVGACRRRGPRCRLGKAAMAGLFQRAIDRGGAAVALTIDGEPVAAQRGDLLITAILLHRAVAARASSSATGSRAGFCLMAACQDCWVRLADGRRAARLLDAGRRPAWR